MASTAHMPAEAATAPATSSRVANVKQNLRFLANPASGAKPSSLVTRTSLSSLRYVLKFVFWRLVRYFKYAAVAAGAAALAGTTIGTILPVAGALLVPSVPVAAAMGLTTAAIKFGWRHRGNHFRQSWLVGGEGRDARKDEQNDAEEADLARPQVHRRAEDAWASEQTFA